MISVIARPARLCASPSTPTTYGSPSARATIAVCEVRPPPSVQNPAASARPSWAASAGDSSCATAMLPFGASSVEAESRTPTRLRSRRSPTSATSLLRSRKYGSSIRSNTAWIWSSALRTAHSAAVLSSRIILRARSTRWTSDSISRCASRIRYWWSSPSRSAICAWMRASCASVSSSARSKRRISAFDLLGGDAALVNLDPARQHVRDARSRCPATRRRPPASPFTRPRGVHPFAEARRRPAPPAP